MVIVSGGWWRNAERRHREVERADPGALVAAGVRCVRTRDGRRVSRESARQPPFSRSRHRPEALPAVAAAMSAAMAALFNARGKPRLPLWSRAMASSAKSGSVRPTSAFSLLKTDRALLHVDSKSSAPALEVLASKAAVLIDMRYLQELWIGRAVITRRIAGLRAR